MNRSSNLVDPLELRYGEKEDRREDRELTYNYQQRRLRWSKDRRSQWKRLEREN